MKFQADQNLHNEHVVLYCLDATPPVRALIAREAIEDLFRLNNLADEQIISLATANQDALSIVATAKVDAGEAYRPRPDSAVQVDLSAAEVEASCVRLSDGVLNQSWNWHRA
jgi:hypothetical protein